jgi:hypothetical protein
MKLLTNTFRITDTDVGALLVYLSLAGVVWAESVWHSRAGGPQFWRCTWALETPLR